MCFPKGPWHGGEQKTKHSFQKKHVYDGRPLSSYIVMLLSNDTIHLLNTGVKPPNYVTSLWTGEPLKVHSDLNISLSMQHTHTHLAGLITYPFAMFRRPKDLDFKRITESHRVEERGLVKKCEAKRVLEPGTCVTLFGVKQPLQKKDLSNRGHMGSRYMYIFLIIHLLHVNW